MQVKSLGRHETDSKTVSFSISHGVQHFVQPAHPPPRIRIRSMSCLSLLLPPPLWPQTSPLLRCNPERSPRCMRGTDLSALSLRAKDPELNCMTDIISTPVERPRLPNSAYAVIATLTRIPFTPSHHTRLGTQVSPRPRSRSEPLQSNILDTEAPAASPQPACFLLVISLRAVYESHTTL